MSVRRRRFVVLVIGLFMATLAFAGGFFGPARVWYIPTAPNGAGNYANGIEFATKGSYDNAPWYINLSNLPSGVGSEDHVLGFVYNGRWNNTTWEKTIATSHWVRMGLESRYVGAGDPSTTRGSFEWNLDIDPNLNATIGSTYRPFFLGFNMDTLRTQFTLGDTQVSTSDPRMEMNWRGKCNFCFWTTSDGIIEFGDRGVMGSDVDSATTQGRIVLDPGNDLTPGTNRAVMIQNLFQEGYLNIEAGLGSGGETREIYLGRQLNGNVVVGTSGPQGHFQVDGNEDEIQAIFMGHSTQTNPILTVETSAGTDIVNVINTGVVRFQPLASPPSSCVQGDAYMDTSGAFCVCVTAGTPGTWNNAVATGTCA